MRIEQIERSMEECQQAGWVGYDITFDCPIHQDQILAWQSLGDFVYLPQLRQPFYRIAGTSFLVKGLEGTNHLRLGMEAEFLDPHNMDILSAFFRL